MVDIKINNISVLSTNKKESDNLLILLKHVQWKKII